jgi:hypothetical protein
VSQLRGKKFAPGEVVALAKQHDVDPTTIRRAARGRSWKAGP